MKAISIRQPWAWLIAEGLKTIETRTWETSYRGELIIAASKTKMTRIMTESLNREFPRLEYNIEYGKGIAIARLVDCRPMTLDDEDDAQCEIYDDAFSWVLDNVRKIEPFDIKGQLGIYNWQLPLDADYEYQERLAIMNEGS